MRTSGNLSSKVGERPPRPAWPARPSARLRARACLCSEARICSFAQRGAHHEMRRVGEWRHGWALRPGRGRADRLSRGRPALMLSTRRCDSFCGPDTGRVAIWNLEPGIWNLEPGIWPTRNLESARLGITRNSGMPDGPPRWRREHRRRRGTANAKRKIPLNVQFPWPQNWTFHGILVFRYAWSLAVPCRLVGAPGQPWAPGRNLEIPTNHAARTDNGIRMETIGVPLESH